MLHHPNAGTEPRRSTGTIAMVSRARGEMLVDSDISAIIISGVFYQISVDGTAALLTDA